MSHVKREETVAAVTNLDAEIERLAKEHGLARIARALARALRVQGIGLRRGRKMPRTAKAILRAGSDVDMAAIELEHAGSWEIL